ncbi:DUF2057 family protein [Serratia surfactantfaciens]|uniref:DUF2057 family protein n=1 Tax=Serratia surfactantfaciens TaxID=2741499 RepID=UPI0018E414D7|nr:DUF2057 family protein [Serratia surfactantfaciens]MBI6150584.1 DUF2057 family protein [Serratia surfactantfaciens]
MKFGLVVAALLSISMPAAATTLKLSPDIDLLVVDGKKMTGSLLKGADSLELDGGQHQLLFKVTKTLHSGQHAQTYVSLPLIATFNTQKISQVAIEIPRIENDRDAQRFDKTLNYLVVDKGGNALPFKQDVLHPDSVTFNADLEKVMTDYNRQNRSASVAAFVQANAGNPSTPSLTGTPLNAPTVTLKGENVSEQMLQYWFQQADKETQKRFLRWANKQPVR